MIRNRVFLIAAFMLIATVASAETLTVTFDDVPADVQCGDVWQESGLDLYFTPTTQDDCDGGGSCYFGFDSGEIWLFPSLMIVDLGGPTIVTRIEIDWYDNCGTGCTRGVAFNLGATVAETFNTDMNQETVTLIPSGGMADSIGVSSCEGAVQEIRIFTDTVDAEGETWGGVKAIFE